jgi:hypothetical protein
MDFDVVIRAFEVFIVIMFFANKLLLLAGKRFGWLLGIIAANLAIVYFYSRGMIPYSVLQVGVLAAMIYGYELPEKRSSLELPVRLTIGAVIMVLCAFVLTGSLSASKALVSIGNLLSNYFLARSNYQRGWLLLGLCNAAAAYFGYINGFIFFADFQMATAIVACIGLFLPKLKDKIQ